MDFSLRIIRKRLSPLVAVFIIGAVLLFVFPSVTNGQAISESAQGQIASMLSQLRVLFDILTKLKDQIAGRSPLLADVSALDSALAGYWKFNEGSGTAVADSSGNSNNGNLINNPLWVDGILSKALNFDGVDDAVNVGSGASLDDLSSFTYAAWIKPDTRGELNAGRIVNKTSDTATIGKRLQFSDVTNNALALVVDRATTDAFAVSAADVFTIGQWQFVAATYDSVNGPRLYRGISGGVLAEVSYGTRIVGAGVEVSEASSNLTIGNRGSAGDRSFDGIIDEVTIYNRVLSIAEISGIFNAGAGVPPPPPTDTQAPSIPQNLTATAISSSQINLSWTTSTDNVGVIGYRIYRGSTQIGTSNTTSFQNTGLSPSTSYIYTVAAYDAAGNISGSSLSVNATTQSLPPFSSWKEVLVKFKSGIDPNSFSFAPWGGRLNRQLLGQHRFKSALDSALKARGLDRVYVVDFPSTVNMANITSQLSAQSAFDYVEPNYATTPTAIPNDSSFSNQWNMHNTGQTGGTTDVDIDAPEAWDVATNSNIVVAVIDSGIDYNHPDLAQNIWTNPGEIAGNGIDDDNNGFIDDVRGWDFTTCAATQVTADESLICSQSKQPDNDPMDPINDGHGTFVAGIIGAVGNNNRGVAGINWSIKIVPIKASLDPKGMTSDKISGVLYALNMGFKVVNNSWTIPGFSQTLFDVLAVADSQGQLFIFGAGNDGRNTDLNPRYPASYDLPGIISVASIGSNGALVASSNYGLVTVDLAAPGYNVYSTAPGNAYKSGSGTSFAAPHVAGAAALFWSRNPSLTNREVKARILAAVDPATNLQGKTVSGGRLNLANLIGTISLPPPPTADTQAPTIPQNLTASVISSSQINLSWSASTDNVGVNDYRIYRSGTQIGTSNTTSFQNTGLNPSTNYTYTVAAHDAVGNISNQSASANATTQPLPSAKFSINDRVQVSSGPLNVRATPSASGVLLGSQSIGVLGVVTGGSMYADNFHWWNVNYDTGADGWSAENYFTKVIISPPPPPPASQPVVSFSVSPSSITSGQSATLTWSSTNASSCTASVGWSGTKAISGTQSVSPTQTTTYTLTCTGSGGSDSKSATVNVTSAPPSPPPPAPQLPILSFSANPTSITSGETIMLTWAGSNVNSCNASGYSAWTGGKTAVGSARIGPLTATSTFSLACSGAGGNVSKTVTIGVLTGLTALPPPDPLPTSTVVVPPPPTAGSQGDIRPPVAVSNLAVFKKTARTLVLSWSAPDDEDSGKASSYDLRYLENDSELQNKWESSLRITQTSTPRNKGEQEKISLVNLKPGVTYFFSVRSRDVKQNLSGFSNILSITTKRIPSKPVISKVQFGSVILSWISESYADGGLNYRIVRGKTPFTSLSDQSLVLVATTTATFVTDNTAEPNTTYYYGVAAYSDEDEYSDLAFVTLTTPAVSSIATIPAGGTLDARLLSATTTPAEIAPGTYFAGIVSVVQSVSQPLFTFNTNLGLGKKYEDIKVLQHFLNIQGFPVSESGLGSIGNETDYFGVKTSEALKKYQCRYNVICSGSPATTGWGTLGAKTRARINGYLTGYNVRLSLDSAVLVPQSPVSGAVSSSDREALIRELQDQIKQLQVKLLQLQLQQLQIQFDQIKR